jgi:hypothetical protein
VTAVRALEIERDEYQVNDYGVVSRGDLVAAAGRGVLGGTTGPVFRGIR